jgi:hypothetical protein
MICLPFAVDTINAPESLTCLSRLLVSDVSSVIGICVSIATCATVSVKCVGVAGSACVVFAAVWMDVYVMSLRAFSGYST